MSPRDQQIQSPKMRRNTLVTLEFDQRRRDDDDCSAFFHRRTARTADRNAKAEPRHAPCNNLTREVDVEWMKVGAASRWKQCRLCKHHRWTVPQNTKRFSSSLKFEVSMQRRPKHVCVNLLPARTAGGRSGGRPRTSKKKTQPLERTLAVLIQVRAPRNFSFVCEEYLHTWYTPGSRMREEAHKSSRDDDVRRAYNVGHTWNKLSRVLHAGKSYRRSQLYASFPRHPVLAPWLLAAEHAREQGGGGNEERHRDLRGTGRDRPKHEVGQCAASKYALCWTCHIRM